VIGKIYFVIILVFSLFAFYYQYITDGFSLNLGLLGQITNFILLLGAYSHYFRKEILQQKYWKYLFYYVITNLLLSFLFSILPGSYSGDFSLLNANLVTNIFVALLGFIVFFPLYRAVYKLSLQSMVYKQPYKKNSKPKKSKKNP
jgi:hypothetical protein